MSRHSENGERTVGGSYAVLAREHRLIERVLASLGRLSEEARRTRRLDGAAAELAIRFLRAFADRVHHLKEEKILFPAIAAQGHFPGCGLIREHEEGRARLGRMADAARSAAEGDQQALTRFVHAARTYISFLRDHIAKEDECLADVVETTFSREGHERLLEELDETERREVGREAFARFEALASELESRLLRPHGEPPPRGTTVT